MMRNLLCGFAIGLVAITASAAPIKYTFDGTATGTLGATSFANAAVTIEASGDSTRVTTVSGILCNDLTSVVVRIGGLGTTAVTDQLLIFDNQALQVLGVSVGTCASPVEDRFNMANPQFAGYDLRGPFGPVTAVGATSGTMKPLNTSGGLLYFIGPPFSFRALDSTVSPVPTLHPVALAALSVLVLTFACRFMRLAAPNR